MLHRRTKLFQDRGARAAAIEARAPCPRGPRRAAPATLWLAAAALVAGCGPAPVRTAPSQLPALTQPLPPAIRTLRVAVRYDSDLARSSDPRARLAPRLIAASAQLQATAGVALDVVGFQAWQPVRPRTTEALLSDLEAEAIPDGADLVVAFTSAPPPRRARVSDLVRSRYAGRHLVARTLAPLYPRDPGGLHDAEVLTLLHGLGRILGALPACSPGVMAPTLGFGLGPAAWRFSAVNAQLMRAHADLPFERAQGRVSAALAQQALSLITPLPEPLRCERAATDRRRQILSAVIAARPAAEAPTPAPQPIPAGVTEGLAALAKGDAAAARALCEPLAGLHPETDASRCAGEAAIQLKDRPAAIRYLRAHLAHHPHDEAVVLLLAKEVGRAGDDGAARALLARFVDQNPSHLSARVNLGIAHARLGDLAAARAAWQAVLDQAPDHPDARQLLDQLPPP